MEDKLAVELAAGAGRSMDQILAVLGSVIGFLAGFVASVLVEPIRRWAFRPRLTVTFSNSEGCIAKTPEKAIQMVPIASGLVHQRSPQVVVTEHPAIYVRVRVENKRTWRGSAAKGCMAYVTGIRRKCESGSFEKEPFFDPAPLAWASRSDPSQPGIQFRPIDLPKGMFHYLDVISTREPEPDRFRLETQFTPFREESVGSTSGSYVATLVVAGDNFDPVRYDFSFSFDGQWNGLSLPG